MVSTYTTNKNIEKPGNGDYVDTWNVPVNSDMDIIDAAFGGVTNLNATGGSAVLTASQYQKLIFNITGAMAADVVFTIPSGVGGSWIVSNTTTDASGGPWKVTINSGGGGTSTICTRGSILYIYSDGTNINLVSGGGGGGATGGGTDQIFWNNGQTITTNYSIPANINSGTFGPVTIDAGATVTIPSTSTWTVV